VEYPPNQVYKDRILNLTVDDIDILTEKFVLELKPKHRNWPINVAIVNDLKSLKNSMIEYREKINENKVKIIESTAKRVCSV